MKSVYQLSNNFPKTEQYGLVSQLRRAAISVPSNIAEGCGKLFSRDLANHLQIALGSAHESRYLAFLSFELGYIDEIQYESSNSIINEIKAMLIFLLKRIRGNDN